jgi:hypothetical protein
MIAMEKMYRKESRKQTLQLAQKNLQLNLELDALLMFKKINKRFTFILCMNIIFIQIATIV